MVGEIIGSGLVLDESPKITQPVLHQMIFEEPKDGEEQQGDKDIQ